MTPPAATLARCSRVSTAITCLIASAGISVPLAFYLGIELPLLLATWLIMAVGASVSARWPATVVLLLAVLLPFETLLPCLLPLPDGIHLAVQLAGELMIYLGLAVVIAQKLMHRQPLRRTPVDLPLIALLLVAGVSILANSAPLLPSLMNLRSLLRYAALFYLVTNINLSPRQVRIILISIAAVGGIQLITAGMQIAGGDSIRQLMMPQPFDISIADQSHHFILVERGRELGSVFGTLGDTIYFGLFLLIVLAIVLAWHLRIGWQYALATGVLMTAVAWSYSRASLLAALLMVGIDLSRRVGRRKSITGLCIIAGVGIICLTLLSPVLQRNYHRNYQHPRIQKQSIVSNATNFLNADYLKRAKRQRLGAILGIAPTVLVNAPVIGFGPAELHTIKSLNLAKPSWLYKRLEKKGFEDVYWVALLCYLGTAGIAVFTWLIVRLLRVSWQLSHNEADSVLRCVATATLLLTAVTPMLLFFMRVLEFRAFSFYFWLLPAMMIALDAHVSSQSATKPTIAEGEDTRCSRGELDSGGTLGDEVV